MSEVTSLRLEMLGTNFTYQAAKPPGLGVLGLSMWCDMLFVFFCYLILFICLILFVYLFTYLCAVVS